MAPATPETIFCTHEKLTLPQLANIAQKLRETDLFVWQNSDNKMLDKQGLFLLAAGYKQAYETALGHMVKTSSAELVSVPDDAEAPAKFLEELGFVYEMHTEPYYLAVSVARNKEALEQLLQAEDSTEMGRLFGYPETAIEAFKLRDTLCLPISEQDKLLAQLCPDEQVRKLCQFRLSKAHYVEEFETVKRWYELLMQYDLLGNSPTASN